MDKNVEVIDGVLINTITISKKVMMKIPKREFKNNDLCCKIALENRERISRKNYVNQPTLVNIYGNEIRSGKLFQTYSSSIWSEPINGNKPHNVSSELLYVNYFVIPINAGIEEIKEITIENKHRRADKIYDLCCPYFTVRQLMELNYDTLLSDRRSGAIQRKRNDIFISGEESKHETTIDWEGYPINMKSHLEV